MRRRTRPALLGALLALGIVALSGGPASAASGGATTIVSITAGDRHTCALTSEAGVVCWGANEFGQLGNGKSRDSARPVAVKGLGHGVVAIDAAAYGTCALLDGGVVQCWGANGSGQLGDGTTRDRHKPVRVGGLPADIVAISAASLHTCALSGTGEVWCWGDNQFGELGTGAPIGTSVSRPVLAASDAGIAAISAGAWNTCAITAATAALCWGGNGTLGSTSQLSALPVGVDGLAGGAAAISSGTGQTCALTDGGEVLCWGANEHGQLGIEGTVYAPTPVPVTGLVGRVTAISAGTGHTCAVVEPGIPYCWGENADGELGDGTTAQRSEPALVRGLSVGVRGIGAGDGHTCALLVNGRGVCWGHGAYGELGNGRRSDSSIPVPVKLSRTPPATDTLAPTAAGGSRPLPLLPLLAGLVTGMAVLILRRPSPAFGARRARMPGGTSPVAHAGMATATATASTGLDRAAEATRSSTPPARPPDTARRGSVRTAFRSSWTVAWPRAPTCPCVGHTDCRAGPVSRFGCRHSRLWHTRRTHRGPEGTRLGWDGCRGLGGESWATCPTGACTWWSILRRAGTSQS